MKLGVQNLKTWNILLKILFTPEMLFKNQIHEKKRQICFY